MSIKIVPQEELTQSQATQVPALLFSNFDKLYPHRRERFSELAKQDHPLQAYFSFLADVAKVQQGALNQVPLTHFALTKEQLTHYPLDIRHWQLGEDWLAIARYILQNLSSPTADIAQLLDTLNKASDETLLEKAHTLLQNPKDTNHAGYWVAMAYWAMLQVRSAFFYGAV